MDNHAYILYPYEGSTFVLVPCGIDYRIWGLDSAAEEIRFPRKFQDGYISPQITLNNSSDPAVPFFHQFHNVRRIYLPEWMTSFEAENFLFPKLKEIVIPDSVVRIEPKAFYGCRGLKNMAIPSSVRRLGSSAFHSCSSLREISLPNRSWVM